MTGSDTKLKKKCFLVMHNGEYVAKSWAVSPEKAINNVRYNNYIKQGIYSYSMDDFDAVEESRR